MRRLRTREVNARNDIVGGGIVISAIVMFVGTGSRAMSGLIESLSGVGAGADNLLSTALLLNIALILFGWRRYKDLSAEIAERTAAEKEAQLLASCDPLTGFLNRRGLADQGAALLAGTMRRDQTLAMLILDLDNFKAVNDAHGHAAGDDLLASVASEVARLMPGNALYARMGGDEFACAFAYDGERPELVEQVAKSILYRLSQPFEAAGGLLHVTVSVGISKSDGDCRTIDALMRRADIAMYSAKHQGRNRFAWFEPVMERELQERNEVVSGIRKGVPAGEFVPYFEQQIDLITGRLRGFEVLARWEHPTRGLLGPETFITVAEDSGCIDDLSFSIMEQAFVEGRDWDPALMLAVNVSPVQLNDPWLAQKFVRLLTKTQFPAHRLEVEITETSLFENLSLAQATVVSLKNQGVRLALDDFGTGYSSLAHLRALPFDRIKIDRSFVTSIHTNAESAAIVSAIARLGDSLGLPVTAEGIEDVGIEERLRQLGCHQGQGWLYGRPLPLAQVRRLLAERNLLPSARAPRAPRLAKTVKTPLKRTA